jgi:hypothetical protein
VFRSAQSIVVQQLTPTLQFHVSIPALSQKGHGDSSSFEMREDNCVIQCDVLTKYEVVFHLAGQKTLHQYSKKMTQVIIFGISVCLHDKQKGFATKRLILTKIGRDLLV